MEAFYDLRRFVYGLRKRYFHKRYPQGALPLIQGLPAGIDQAEVEAVCADHFGEKVCSISHIHLSGWKSAGAYRLFIQTESSRQVNLVYKNSIYQREDIPALAGLPIQPGPAEYTVLSQAVGPLAPYLPQVFLAEELTPGLHYRYIMEDLFQDYHIVSDVEEIMNSARLLAELQQALLEWAIEVDTRGMLTYGRECSLEIQEYARKNLEIYAQRSNEPILKQVLSNWALVTQLHLDPEFFALPAQYPIHGDSNYTNIHLHRQNPRKFKLVDWEWAGFGNPFADLASLMKGVPPEFERKAFKEFTLPNGKPNPSLVPDLSPQESWRYYQWCQLERGLLDASFLAVQHINSLHNPIFSLPQAVTFALRRVWSACQQLSR